MKAKHIALAIFIPLYVSFLIYGIMKGEEAATSTAVVFYFCTFAIVAFYLYLTAGKKQENRQGFQSETLCNGIAYEDFATDSRQKSTLPKTNKKAKTMKIKHVVLALLASLIIAVTIYAVMTQDLLPYQLDAEYQRNKAIVTSIFTCVFMSSISLLSLHVYSQHRQESEPKNTVKAATETSNIAPMPPRKSPVSTRESSVFLRENWFKIVALVLLFILGMLFALNDRYVVKERLIFDKWTGTGHIDMYGNNPF